MKVSQCKYDMLEKENETLKRENKQLYHETLKLTVDIEIAKLGIEKAEAELRKLLKENSELKTVIKYTKKD